MKDNLGKIEHDFFNQFIKDRCGFHRPEVSTAPQFGVDVAIVDLPNNMAMALTSDPLSLIPTLGLEESAFISVQLMTNDMATTGFSPMFGQFVLNLPATFSKSDFKIYWEYIHKFCKKIGISITGGHTGFIEDQNSTIAGGGTFITLAEKSKLRTSTMAQAGDSVLVTKQCATSSSAILAMSFPETIKNKVGTEIYQKACESFYQISSLEDALTTAGKNHEHNDITAMHDVTEGGVLGAIYELTVASDNGILIENNKLPLGKVQTEICSVFGLDQRYTLGSGAMIITCKNGTAPQVIERLAKENITCTEVGILTNKSEGLHLLENDIKTPLPYYQEDAYWAAYFKAKKMGCR